MIHNLELSLPYDGRNILVIKQPSEFRIWPNKLQYWLQPSTYTRNPCYMSNWQELWFNSQYIQGVSRLVGITAGGDFLGLCDQKSSYKHVSDFGQLWSYGHFLNPVHALMWSTLWNQLAGDVLNLVAYRLRCKHYFCHLTHAPSCKQSSFRITTLGRYLRNVGEGGVGGYSLGQSIQHDSATTACSKTLITYITVIVPARDVQNSMVIVS